MSTDAGLRYAGITCPHCGTPRDARSIVSGAQSCPVCERRFEAVRFDPPRRELALPRVAEAGPEGAHPCPRHAANASVGHCSRCGVFLCALCRIEVDRRVLCPACFERLDDGGELPGLVWAHRDYARVQASVTLLGLLLPFLAPIAGPGALYYASRALRQLAPGDARGRLKIHAVSALAVLELVGAAAFVVWMVSR